MGKAPSGEESDRKMMALPSRILIRKLFDTFQIERNFLSFLWFNFLTEPKVNGDRCFISVRFFARLFHSYFNSLLFRLSINRIQF